MKKIFIYTNILTMMLLISSCSVFSNDGVIWSKSAAETSEIKTSAPVNIVYGGGKLIARKY